MHEEAFEVAIDGGVLRGHRGGTGASALLLHGGAAVPDYMAECAAALDGLFATIRYTQRGTPPSEAGPPFTIESHAADAVAVLDALGIDRAWAIGHSWGGHLALHLAHLHEERLLGLLLIDPLGADPTVFVELDANLRRGLSDEERARVDEIEEATRRRRRRGRPARAFPARLAAVLRTSGAGQPTAGPGGGTSLDRDEPLDRRAFRGGDARVRPPRGVAASAIRPRR